MSSWRSARLAGAAVAGLALTAAGLAGPAGAARAGAGVQPAGSVPGSISTVAGGPGGPGPATSIAIGACGVRWAGGSLYIGDGSTVRRVNTATGALTTVAGDNAAGPADASGAAVGYQQAARHRVQVPGRHRPAVERACPGRHHQHLRAGRDHQVP